MIKDKITNEYQFRYLITLMIMSKKALLKLCMKEEW